ncbi:hypothetical protein [Burkholderia multivorans]|uniref:hypothetical protein n=1 Tax=Burkholderia multivorans TaxID=87883 RepID=UPI0020135619|nr:hypothetical protein [Burkholderia multivorans]
MIDGDARASVHALRFARRPPRAFGLASPIAARRTGRTADCFRRRSRFKIFPTDESAIAVARTPRIFRRANRHFIERHARENRVACMR